LGRVVRKAMTALTKETKMPSDPIIIIIDLLIAFSF
jgi:hypothetical protein